MINARVTAVLRSSSGKVAYTIDRAGPAPKVTQLSQMFVGVVQGARLCASDERAPKEEMVRTLAATRNKFRIVGMCYRWGVRCRVAASKRSRASRPVVSPFFEPVYCVDGQKAYHGEMGSQYN
jgi:hypothetical protein